MDEPTKIFLAGCVGALAPEVVRLYGLATAGERVTWSPGFYIPISVALALLGGFIAFILPCENLQSGFYAGIGTPALITAAARKARGPAGLESSEGAAAAQRDVPPGFLYRRRTRRLSRLDAFIQAL